MNIELHITPAWDDKDPSKQGKAYILSCGKDAIEIFDVDNEFFILSRFGETKGKYDKIKTPKEFFNLIVKLLKLEEQYENWIKETTDTNALVNSE